MLVVFVVAVVVVVVGGGGGRECPRVDTPQLWRKWSFKTLPRFFSTDFHTSNQ